MSPALHDKLETLPALPGVYIFRDSRGTVLYVGKAKSLRSRVRSYFQPSARQIAKTASLVDEIADLEIIVVDNEMEAFILEANLIKGERPRFNVILRDDKTFPYLKLATKDVYPRLSLVRRARLDGNAYFGPFIPASVARRSLKLVPRYFRVATCNEVFDGKRRPCLYYHLDQCLAPCAGKTNPEEYAGAVKDARLFLEGRHRDLTTSLEQRMREASDAQEFERAARHRDTLRTLEKLAVRQQMASVGLEDQDYLAHHVDGKQLVLELFQVREGRVQGRREFAVEDVVFEPRGFYSAAMVQYYAEAAPPREIYLSHLPDDHDSMERWLSRRRGGRVRLSVPARGAKRRFLDLVENNARLAFEARFRIPHRQGVEGLEALARVLRLDEPPFRIECFDISNIQGTDAVASMVMWEGGKPRKSEYRSYNIRSVQGPDDYASMAEAVTRRYRRLLKEDKRLPDLVLIDGGPGQLGAAVRSLAAVGLPMIPVIALAKREEEIHLESGGDPIRLDRADPALRLVQQIRDEAHRFAVTRHRRRRKRRTVRTQLTELPGVGPATARKLLKAFGSLAGVKKAPAEELRRVAGRRVAEAVRSRYGAPELLHEDERG